MKISEILTDETKWTKGTYARDAAGNEVSSNDPRAVCFCLLGAVNHPDNANDSTDYAELLWQAIIKEFPKGEYWSVVNFNDNSKTTFADIQAFLKKHDL